MSNENHNMQLRPRKSVLGDISNRASLPGGVDPHGGKGVVKTNKRLVSQLVLIPLPTCLSPLFHI